MKRTTQTLIRLAKANRNAPHEGRKIMAGAKRRIMKRIGRKAYRDQLTR